MTTIGTAATTQVYQTYIKATPEAVWNGLTTAEQTKAYGYRSPVEYDLEVGGAFRAYPSEEMRSMGAADVIIEGEVLEVDAPRKLVQTWHALFDETTAAETVTRLSFELEEAWEGVIKLTLTHELGGAPITAALVSGSMPNTGGGWSFMLSDLKTLLETGASLSC